MSENIASFEEFSGQEFFCFDKYHVGKYNKRRLMGKVTGGKIYVLDNKLI
jgi:hypothetical protein